MKYNSIVTNLARALIIEALAIENIHADTISKLEMDSMISELLSISGNQIEKVAKNPKESKNA